MIELAGYTYDDHKACIVCRHVADGLPILAFAHDEDGDLRFTCGSYQHDQEDLLLIGLSHLLEQLRSMKGLPDVHRGFCAERSSDNDVWSLEPLDE